VPCQTKGTKKGAQKNEKKVGRGEKLTATGGESSHLETNSGGELRCPEKRPKKTKARNVNPPGKHGRHVPLGKSPGKKGRNGKKNNPTENLQCRQVRNLLVK